MGERDLQKWVGWKNKQLDSPFFQIVDYLQIEIIVTICYCGVATQIVVRFLNCMVNSVEHVLEMVAC